MHYGKSTFAKEVSQVTILPKRDPETELIPEIGQRDQLSPGDIRQTSKMYRCTGKANKKQYVHADRHAAPAYQSRGANCITIGSVSFIIVVVQGRSR